MEYNRLNILRPDRVRFDDLANLVVGTFYTYRSLETYLSPIISKSFDSAAMITPEEIGALVKKHPNMSPIMFSKMLEAAASFCNRNKGSRKLPLADPKTHRSAHYKQGLFEIEPFDLKTWLEMKPMERNYKVNSVARVFIDGIADPIYVENLRIDNYKYMIIRPKLSKMYNISNNWEALFFKSSFDYHIDHIDLDYQPKSHHFFNQRSK